MTKIKNSLVLFSLLAASVFLQACQTSSGYKRGGWGTPTTATQAPAQTIPGTTAQQTAAATQNALRQVPAENLPPVKVGILLPLSGQNQKLGQAMLNASQIALFDIGHSNFELVPRDTRGTEDGARSAAREAVNEGAQLILGPLFAQNVRAAKPITQSGNINMVAFSTDWTLAGGNTYIMGFLPFDQVERVTAYAAKQGIRRVGVMAPNTDYGRIVQSTFATVGPRFGMNIAQSASFSPRSNNLAPDIRTFTRYDARVAANALTQAPFDAVLMPTGGQQARAIANLLTHNELPPSKVRRLGTGLFDDDALATEFNLEGAWFAAPSPNARRVFESKYTRTFGERPPRLSTLAYDATALAAVLARKGLSEGRRPAYDRRSISNPNGFSGIDGIFRFRPNGTAERGLAVLEFDRGQIKIVEEAPKTFQTITQALQPGQNQRPGVTNAAF